jgi:hypothetical protein
MQIDDLVSSIQARLDHLDEEANRLRAALAVLTPRSAPTAATPTSASRPRRPRTGERRTRPAVPQIPAGEAAGNDADRGEKTPRARHQ